jgi:hypothetical protein
VGLVGQREREREAGLGCLPGLARLVWAPGVAQMLLAPFFLLFLFLFSDFSVLLFELAKLI